MRYLIIFFCLSMCSYTHAEFTLPAGCQAVAISGEAITLTANTPLKKNKLVYIHNISYTDIWITHPTTHSGASAGWASRLQAGNWSALSLHKRKFVLTCIESKPGHEQQIPCPDSVVLCQWQKFKSTTDKNKQQTGTFWVAENQSLAALNAAVGKRGFILPKALKNEEN